jgi:hypothetical protein
MNELLVNIADALAEAASAQTGIAATPVSTPKNPIPSAPTPSRPLRQNAKNLSSPALSQDKPGDTVKGRKIAILADKGVDARQLKAVKGALAAQEAVVELIAAHAERTLAKSKGLAGASSKKVSELGFNKRVKQREPPWPARPSGGPCYDGP